MILDKVTLSVAKEIARQYSCLVGRRDDYSLGKKIVLVDLASVIGFDVIVSNEMVILASIDGSYRVLA